MTRWWASRPDAAVDIIPRFINTPIDSLGAALFDLAGGLAVYVAAADGVIAPAERKLIRDHLVADWGFDAAYSDPALALLEQEVDAAALEAVARSMARFMAASPDCNARVIRAELMISLAGHFELMPGTRQIFTVAVDEVQASCGWGVPEMAVVRERETLVKYARNLGAERLLDVMAVRTRSIDGLPTRASTAAPGY